MITTDATYNTLIASGSYEESITGTLKDGSGTTVLNISNEYIKTGSLIIDNKCINNDDLEPGAVYAAELKITITGNAGLTSSQKSSLQNGSLNLTYTITDGNSSSSISIGIYYIIEVTLKDEDVEIIAEDMMSRLSKNIPTAVREDLNFVARTPYELLDLCCQNCSTSRRPISLVNDETEFDTWCNAGASFLIPVTADIATYRDLVAEVAKIMGCFATIDKATNGLILKRLNPHSNSNVWTLNEDIRYSTEKSGYVCLFGKVALGNVSYPTTSDEDVSGLILSMRASELTDDSEVLPGIVQNLYTELSGISYRPCKIDFMGNIALEVGDWIGVNYTEDEQTYTFRTIITHFTWILNGKELIESTGSSAATTKKVGSKGSGESRNSSSIDNLESRIETLESSGSGNKIYTSKTAPDNTLGNEGDLWVKYFTDYNDILVNSHGDEVEVNLPRYESADDAYNYVDLTIRPQIRSMCNLTTTAINAFVKAFQGGISIVAYQGSSPTRNITASQFSQLTADTYTTNNQSFSVSNGNNFLSWSDNPIHYRYIGVSESDLLPFGAIVNVDDFNENLFSGHETTVLYYYVYYNTSNKKFEYIFGSIKFKNVNHTYWSDKLSKYTSNITIDLLDTAYYTIDELYCKINDDWTLYDDDDSTTVIVNQVLTSGIEIAQISVDGEVVSIYAPTTTVTQVLSSGTEIAQINGTSLYAPTGGGGGGGGSGYTETSLWSGYKSDTGTISLNDSVENYDVILIKVTSHPSQPSNKYYESYFIILPSEINYSQNAQYDILVVRGAVNYGNGSIEGYFPSSTSFIIEAINIDQSARQVKPAVLEIIGLKFGGSGGHNYSTNEQVVGTWIDGSTVYEKTQYGGITFSSQGTWYDTDITNIDKIVSVQGSIIRDGEPINIGYWNSSITSCWVLKNHTLKMCMQAMASGETYTLNSITVRYTKTS